MRIRLRKFLKRFKRGRRERLKEARAFRSQPYCLKVWTWGLRARQREIVRRMLASDPYACLISRNTFPPT